MDEKKIINLEDFFIDKNEAEGVWHEPVFDDKPCGLQFLLIGIHCDEAVKKQDEYDKKAEAVRKSDLSDEEKQAKLEDIDAERVAVLTKDMRTTDGSALMMNGKPFVFSTETVKELYKNCVLLKMDNVDFVLKASNFIKR